MKGIKKILNFGKRTQDLETIKILPLLTNIDTDLKKHEITGILFGSSLYYLHTSPQTKVKDVDVLLLNPGHNKTMDLGVDDGVDYFYCKERQAPHIFKEKMGRKDVVTFANGDARAGGVTLSFQYNRELKKQESGLIIPNLAFFWYLKRIEFESMGIGYAKEIKAILEQEQKENPQGYYFNNQYLGSNHCFSVEHYLENKLKPFVREKLDPKSNKKSL